MVIGAKALVVAEEYDRMTAINSAGEPQSEFAQMKIMMDNPEYFEPDAVNALLGSINLLAEGVCVELSTGEKALVTAANPDNIFRPVVLCFSTNTIIDLSMTALYNDIEIVDVMKTYDNRYVLKKDEDADDNAKTDHLLLHIIFNIDPSLKYPKFPCDPRTIQMIWGGLQTAGLIFSARKSRRKILVKNGGYHYVWSCVIGRRSRDRKLSGSC